MTAQPAPQADVSLKQMANAIRALSMDAVERANSGHPGMPMGMADVATVLFNNHLHLDVTDPHWPDRDRFVLSCGHGSMLLYSLAYLLGYEDMTVEELKNFRQLHSRTPGHPELDLDIGVETTTGPLGQGIGAAVGMALAERLLNNRFGGKLVDHYTYAMVSDGDLMEGISHEACSLAGHLNLNHLVVLYDANEVTIDGPSHLSESEDAAQRFAGYGWDVWTVNGHDMDEIDQAIGEAKATDRPAIIICRTKIGFGAPNKQGKSAAHGAPLGGDEIAGARDNLNWPHDPFVVPDDIMAAWRGAGQSGHVRRMAWQERLANHELRDDFLAAQDPIDVDDLRQITQHIIDDFQSSPSDMATRKAGGMVLDTLTKEFQSLIGGSADLTPSNKTKTGHTDPVKPPRYAGRYIHYGVREHAMGAVMNGLALHRGVIPYGGSFLTFSDYARPAIRIAALMGQPVIYVMTHDSIGLGEDGPTHQPVEHLASLRAMPGVQVLRPADPVEVAECWEMALRYDGPTILSLTRQSVPFLRHEPSADNQSAKGAYRISTANGAKLTIVATGSEVGLATAVADGLDIPANVVSMPHVEGFLSRDSEQRSAIIPDDHDIVVIEAGHPLGWHRIAGKDGLIIGVEDFGESAPYQDVYATKGLTVPDIIDRITDHF